MGSITDPIPWPEKGDHLFSEQGNWHYNAILDKFHNDWTAYIEGYGRAAQALITHLENTGCAEVDFLVYPIIFLFRQHLELRLKALIMEGDALHDRDPKLHTIHKLEPLWAMCREVLESVWPEGSSETLDVVESCILELAAVDRGSCAFRYPVEKDGARSLPADLDRINLEHFGEVMVKIYNFFSGAHDGISDYLQTKHEMDQEWRAEMEQEWREEMEQEWREEAEQDWGPSPARSLHCTSAC